MVKRQVLGRPCKEARRTDRAALGKLADNLVTETTMKRYRLSFDEFLKFYGVQTVIRARGHGRY